MDAVATTSVTKTNSETTVHDLFALSDEQILEIEPEAEGAVTPDLSSVTREEKPNGRAQASSEPAHGEPRNTSVGEKTSIDAQAAAHDSSTGHGQRSTEHDAEPPAWLAAQMKDPW